MNAIENKIESIVDQVCDIVGCHSDNIAIDLRHGGYIASIERVGHPDISSFPCPTELDAIEALFNIVSEQKL
jgi:hypothetical protein